MTDKIASGCRLLFLKLKSHARNILAHPSNHKYLDVVNHLKIVAIVVRKLPLVGESTFLYTNILLNTLTVINTFIMLISCLCHFLFKYYCTSFRVIFRSGVLRATTFRFLHNQIIFTQLEEANLLTQFAKARVRFPKSWKLVEQRSFQSNC